MSDLIDTCSRCLQPKKISKSARMTQWIFICNCEGLNDTANSISYQLCKSCSKRIQSESSGSLTQWVFKEDFCKCVNKEVIDVSITPHKPDSTEIHNQSEQIKDLIEVDSDLLPVDRYLPIEKLGEGASGAVYLCKDRLLENEVAVKTLRFLNSEQLLSFQNEARLISQLTHPRVVKIMDFGATDAGYPYMVLEYIDGVNLKLLLLEKGRLSWEEACQIVVQMCEALTYTHGKGVYHRDLKPSNIMIEDLQECRIKLIDFGVAALKLDRESQVDYQGTTIVGTPAYMGPDQANGYSYDSRSEVYSIGCVLFELLTGEQLLLGETALETINRHINETIPPISKFIRDDYPKKLDKILSTCLAKNPDDRYQNVELLQNAFLDLFNSTETQNLSTKKLEAFRSVSKRVSGRKLFLSVVTIVVLFLSFSLLFPFVNRTPLENAEKPSPATKKIDAIGADLFSTKFQMNNSHGDWWWFNMSPMSDAEIKDLARLKNLRNLWIDVGSLSVDSILSLKKYKLKKLGLIDVPLSGEHMEALSQLSTLEELHLIENRIQSDDHFSSFKNLTDLKSLLINSQTITNNSIEILSKSTDLTILSLNGCKNISDVAIKSLTKMKNLERLSLADTSFTEDGIIKVTRLEKLIVLSLARLPCSKKSINEVSKMKLKKLSLRYCKLSKEDMKVLANIPSLEFLDVRDALNINAKLLRDFQIYRHQKNYNSCFISWRKRSSLMQAAEALDSTIDDYRIWK